MAGRPIALQPGCLWRAVRSDLLAETAPPSKDAVPAYSGGAGRHRVGPFTRGAIWHPDQGRKSHRGAGARVLARHRQDGNADRRKGASRIGQRPRSTWSRRGIETYGLARSLALSFPLVLLLESLALGSHVHRWEVATTCVAVDMLRRLRLAIEPNRLHSLWV